MFIHVDLNIGAERYFPEGPFRRAEAQRSVKMFYIPRGVEGIGLDEAVPDFLVTVRVPKILTPNLPEILAPPATAGGAKNPRRPSRVWGKGGGCWACSNDMKCRSC